VLTQRICTAQTL